MSKDQHMLEQEEDYCIFLPLHRYGLSEAELKDILSLDNDILSEVYQHHPPPSKVLLRLPPLLWAQLYHDLTPWLVEKWADGFILMGFSHRSVVLWLQLPSTPSSIQS